MESVALDVAAGVSGVACSSLMSKSRSVPAICYRRVGIVLCGSLAGCALRVKGAARVGVASCAATATLLCLGRWDNARAEVAPRWEPHGRGATGPVGAAWAGCLVASQGVLFGAVLRRAFEKAPRAFAVVFCGGLAFLASRDGVSHPGGPRPHRIDRTPEWSPARKRPSIRGWRCATGEASHAVTAAKARDGAALTGEAAGRQIWHYVGEANDGADGAADFDPSKNPNASDQLYRRERLRAWAAAHPGETTTADGDALVRGLSFYQKLQCDDGHWGGDYGGPHFLSPGLVIMWYVTGRRDDVLDGDQRRAMVHYYECHQQVDGGWGTHVESPSTMFGSVLTYVALRLLGADRDSAVLADARRFILDEGGACYTSSWAKFALCLLGAMDWECHESVPPEMWLLPCWCPFHPCRMWCHARMVYLPMGYLWGKRWTYADAETDAVVLALREELYDPATPYGAIDWRRTRTMIAPMDDYSPVHPVMVLGQRALRCYEDSFVLGPARRFLRRRGLAFCADYCHAEDLQTNYVCIGPVNKVYNMVVAYDRRGDDGGAAFAAHALRVADYLWVAEDGMKMQGYNGSQCWDASFATQALAESDLGDDPRFAECARRAWAYLERTQILSTEASQNSPAYDFEAAPFRERYFRHVSKGGWPFSTSAHGWPISDCTAEGLKSVLALRRLATLGGGTCDAPPGVPPISFARLCDAVDVVLALQNADGGFATYENNRGYGWYEWLNPSEVFGDIMIDYSYVECSMASNGALARFRDAFPNHRRPEIDAALRRGNSFLKSIQRPDGSWYGSWACCFTYAGWFGIEGLVDAGEDPATSEPLRRACDFLLAHQRPNGGWGEDFTSCFDKAYATHGMQKYGDAHGAGVVNTAWALLGLMAGECPDMDAVARGVAYLEARQLPDGDWPQEGISGVFNRACGITYTSYRNVFPIWALARFKNTYVPKMAKATIN